MGRLASACWFTNIDHGKRHEWLKLDTMAHNLKFNKKLRRKLEKEFKGIAYPHYDNYDAIEVPYIECIPSDYAGAMGVPITFLDRYGPEQFEILGLSNVGDLLPGAQAVGREWVNLYRANGGRGHVSPSMKPLIGTDKEGKPVLYYRRLIIRNKMLNKEADKQ